MSGESRHLLVIGAQRCGTTYLLRALESHPDITSARPARPEPKVFVTAEVTEKGADWYRATYFAHAKPGQLMVDKSTSYLDVPQAAFRAGKMLADARVQVVAQLRDPVDRAVSNWRFSTSNGLEDRPLERALAEGLKSSRDWDPTSTSTSPFAYLERGRYADHLAPWLETFPGAVQVCFVEETGSSFDAVVRLLRALGLDPYQRAGRSDAGADRANRRANSSEGPRPVLPAGLLAELRAYFHDSDQRLSMQLGRSLPWTTTETTPR